MSTIPSLLRACHAVPARSMATIFVLLIVATASSIAAGQQDDDPPVKEAQSASTELTATDQIIEVGTPIADKEIGDRLTRILSATGRFDDPRVEVRDGVVFLSGRTADAGNRDWAGDLARKTEDVVAVVNNIEVEDGPLWTLEPAVREVRKLWRQFIQAVPLLIIGFVVLFGTYVGARVFVRVMSRHLERRIKSGLLRNVVEKILFLCIILIGIYLFLRISGLTRIAMTLAGGTGLVGLVAGFAFRDIAENFLASVLISVQRPFQIGDTVEVDGHIGVIQKVTTRGTVLMNFDGDHIQIANSTVYKNTIRNLTANPNVRIGFAVGVGYDSSVTSAQQLALEVLRDHSAVLDSPEPIVLLEELGPASISIRVYFWINGHEHSMLKVRSSLMRLIIRAYEEAGISLPDEAREVIFPHAVPVRMLTEAEAEQPISRPTAPSSAEDNDETTEAEGDLRSEVADIQQQANESRIPEEGEDIMSGNDEPTADSRKESS